MVIASSGEQAIEKVIEISQHQQLEDDTCHEITSVHEKRDYFDILGTVNFLSEGGYKRIALQFPDSLLSFSSFVASELKSLLSEKSTRKKMENSESMLESTGSSSTLISTFENDEMQKNTLSSSSEEFSVFILADTSYGSCCVDEVAAQHGNADVIVHYGDACLSATERLPVYYVYGKKKLNQGIESICGEMNETLNNLDIVSNLENMHIIIIPDPAYQYAMTDLVECLKRGSKFKNIDCLHIPNFSPPHTSLEKQTSEDLLSPSDNLDNSTKTAEKHNSTCTPNTISCLPTCCSAKEETSICCESNGTRVCEQSQTQTEPLRPTQKSLSSTLNKFKTLSSMMATSILDNRSSNVNDIVLVYFGNSKSYSLSSLLMSHSQHQIYCYDPYLNTFCLESMKANKFLMRRYFMIQQAREAEVIGIVVGTLGIANYMSIIQQIIQLIQRANKKYYLFSVGKPSPAKLGNFLEIDVFVMISCSQNILMLDEQRSEYMKPVITPFELLVSLGSSPEDQYDETDNSRKCVWIPGSQDLQGRYLTRFSEIIEKIESVLGSRGSTLKSVQQHAESRNIQKTVNVEEDDDEPGPSFSLISGKLRKTTLNNDSDDVLATNIECDISLDGGTKNTQWSLTETKYNSSKHHLIKFSSAGGYYLNRKRTYKGLEQKLNQTPISVVEEGRRGIAKGYRHEPEK